jgi:hypothetical protein
MAITINGTTGLAGVDGSASTPAVQGADSNTGVFFPAADTVAIATGGAERVRVDSVGEVTRFNTNPGGITLKRTDGVNSNGWLNFVGSDDVVDGSVRMATDVANALTFQTAATERARIDSSGNLLVNTTSADARFVVVDAATSGWGARILKSSGSGTPQGLQVVVGQNSSNEVFQCAQGTSFGSITNLFKVNGNGLINTATASSSPYNNTTGSAANMVVTSAGDLQRSTSSLKYKTDINDATHGLAEVMLLRPVTYKGKNDGDIVFGGLIAEEVHAAGLTEFVQYAEDGSPDALAYGNMVSLCIKAIQELKAELDTAKARIAALEAA